MQKVEEKNADQVRALMDDITPYWPGGYTHVARLAEVLVDKGWTKPMPPKTYFADLKPGDRFTWVHPRGVALGGECIKVASHEDTGIKFEGRSDTASQAWAPLTGTYKGLVYFCGERKDSPRSPAEEVVKVAG